MLYYLLYIHALLSKQEVSKQLLESSAEWVL